jgi:hypothetical protein
MKKVKKAKKLKMIGGGLNFVGNPYKKAKKGKSKKFDPFSFGKGDGTKSGNSWLKKFSKGAKY